MQGAWRGFYLTLLRLRQDGPESSSVVVLEEVVAAELRWGWNDDSSSKFRHVLGTDRGPSKRRPSCSKFLFPPSFGSGQRSSALSALRLPFLFAPSLGSLLFDEPLDLSPQGLQTLLLKRERTYCLFYYVGKRLLICFYIISCPLPTVVSVARKYSHSI